MTEHDESFLFANERFYAAFAGGDADAMAALWAESAPLLCVHPGAAPLFGRAQIIASWREILAEAGVAGMRMRAPRLLRQHGMALVVCFESLGGNLLTAVNGFVLEAGAPRMVMHQAGPCREAPPEGSGDGGDGGPLH